MPEQVPLAALAAAVSAGIAAAAGRAAIQHAGGVSAGGLALAEQVVAVLAGDGGFAAGLGESAAGLAAAAGGTACPGQQQAQPKLAVASQRLQAKVEAFRTRKETIKATYTAPGTRSPVPAAPPVCSPQAGRAGPSVAPPGDLRPCRSLAGARRNKVFS